MDFALSEEQEALRETARSFLAEHSSSERVRRAMEGELGFDPETWKRIAAELGWPALIVPEAQGGLGLGWVELAVLLEATGESLLCAPFFSSVCLAANAILAAGSDAQQRELLPGIAEGRTLATLAWTGPGGAPGLEGIEATYRVHAGEARVSGDARYVIDGHCADLLVVAARRAGGKAEEISLFAIPADAAGVERRALATLDPTRRLAELRLRDVRVPRSAILGEEGAAGAPLARALDLAAVALAAEQTGGAQRCLDLAVEYAKQRVQFGRPIGSFQAIQHKCADMLLRVESARSASQWAACVAAEGGDELARAASLAKSYCSEAYFFCAAECLQIHGGVGFTWEYDVHLHLKRAQGSQVLLGDPAWHRERVARLIGL
jgi:alkylation response protein AidB-like acyl-CoA dehydrogenase